MRENFFFHILRPKFWLALGALLLAVVSLAGLPMGNDEGVWAYIGRLWADHGLLPYTGAVENKATGIYMVYAVSHALFGFQVWFPRLLAMAATLATGWLIYYLARRLAGERAALFSLAIFVLVMPLASVDGGYAETENFMNLFRALGFFLTVIAYDKRKNRTWLLFAAGASSAIAISFKQLAVLDAIPLIAFHFFANCRAAGGAHFPLLPDTLTPSNSHSTSSADKSGRGRDEVAGATIKNIFIVFIGALVGLFLTLAPYLAAGGAIRDFIDGAIVLLFQSGSSPASAVSRVSGFFRHFFNARLFPLVAGAAVFVFASRVWRDRWWRVPLLIWTATDFFAYNADGWYLDHHYKVFIPSWSLAFGIAADWLLSRVRLAREGAPKEHLAAFCLFALLAFYVPFETNYFHTIRKALKGEFANQPERALGEYLKEKTAPGERVYIWGFHIGVPYYYSDRLAPSRYFSEPFLGRPGALSELMRDLSAHPPRLVAAPEAPYRPLPDWFTAYLDKKYRLAETKYSYHIYERL